jgi:hypothetical protein
MTNHTLVHQVSYLRSPSPTGTLDDLPIQNRSQSGGTVVPQGAPMNDGEAVPNPHVLRDETASELSQSNNVSAIQTTSLI